MGFKIKEKFPGFIFFDQILHKIDIYIYLILLQLSHQRPISSHFPALVCYNVDNVNLCQNTYQYRISRKLFFFNNNV